MIKDDFVLSFYFYLFVGLALIALELVTTTFYLLLIGIACLIASLSALILHDWLIPTLSAGILSLIACYLLSKRKGKRNSGQMLVTHLGQSVEVVEVNADKLLVLYSGTYWKAITKSSVVVKVGDHLVISKFSNHELELEEEKIK